MKEIFEKIIERLEVEVEYQNDQANESDTFEEISVRKARQKMGECYEHAIEIVNQVAEEYSNSEIPNMLLDSLHEKILKSKFAEEVTEAEIDALVKAKNLTNTNQSLTNDGWIPVSERLPKYSKDVLITTRSLICDVGAYLKGSGWIQWFSDGGIPVDVIAWRELPAPYQPKGEK